MRRSAVMWIAIGLIGAAISGCQFIGDDDGTSSTLSPRRPNEADEQRLAEAMAGLIYEERQVMIDPALADQAGWASDQELQALLDEAEAILKRGRAIRAIAVFTRAVIAAPRPAT